MKIFLSILLAALIFIPAASSGTIKGYNWSPAYRYFLTSMDTPEPPDGGMHAYNTTGCAWNDEDQSLDTSSGDLTATTTDTMCLVADYAGGNSAYPHTIIAKVFVPKSAPKISVWLTNDQGDSWSPTTIVVPYKQQLVYEFCYKDPVALRGGVGGWDQLANVWSEIPGTGGYGQIVNYTIHIQTSKTVHGMYAYYGIEWNPWSGGPLPGIQSIQPGPVPCS